MCDRPNDDTVLEQKVREEMNRLGLDEKNFTVIEGIGEGCPAGPIYRPQADISNLFLPLVEAALNHIEQSIDGNESKFAYFRHRLSSFFHKEALRLDGFQLGAELGELVESVTAGENKEEYDRFFRSFFRSCLVAYTFAARAKLCDDAHNLVSNDPVKYFALLDIFDDLSDDTKIALINDFKKLNLWGVSNEA